MPHISQNGATSLRAGNTTQVSISWTPASLQGHRWQQTEEIYMFSLRPAHVVLCSIRGGDPTLSLPYKGTVKECSQLSIEAGIYVCGKITSLWLICWSFNYIFPFFSERGTQLLKTLLLLHTLSAIFKKKKLGKLCNTVMWSEERSPASALVF